MVTSPLTLSLDDLKKMNGRELVAGFECSGNSPRLVQGFAGNGKWTGIPLRLVLDQAGVLARRTRVRLLRRGQGPGGGRMAQRRSSPSNSSSAAA